MADATKKSASKILTVDMRGRGPHNGEGRPALQFPDPITGEMIGGQVAAVRMAMRYRHTVYPWARRQGKTRFREYLYPNEATITPGPYWAGIVFPDHTTAFKVADIFRASWGGMVKDFKINDKDQDRWIELHPLIPPKDKPPPAWFTPGMAERWRRCQSGTPNTSCKVWFWGGAHPHYEKIQGFPHPFHRIDWDEAQQDHPAAYGVVRPMLRDVRGSECITGTPWSAGIGNVKFEQWWDLAADADDWFRMSIPDGTNPHVPRTDMAEARRTMSDAEIRQTLYAEFLSDAGAVFTNLDRVFVLKPLKAEDTALDWLRALRSKWSMPSMRWWASEAGPVAGHVYAASIDWARSPRGDWTAISVMDLTTGRQALIARWRGENFNEQLEVVAAIKDHWKCRQCHTDANGMGEAMADFLRRRHSAGFVGHRFGRNKADYVRKGQMLFLDADVALIDCEEQRHEFKSFSAFEPDGIGSEKHVKYCAPDGGHDDMVAAFLQLAPTITISGRQTEPPPDPAPEPLFVKGATTLEKWAADAGVPFPVRTRADEQGLSWDDIVLPPSMR
jgi:hypothetical protein